MGIFHSFRSQGEYPLHHPAFWILRVRTEPEFLAGVPKALHVGPPALEEVQLPGVPPLEDLKREMVFPLMHSAAVTEREGQELGLGTWKGSWP